MPKPKQGQSPLPLHARNQEMLVPTVHRTLAPSAVHAIKVGLLHLERAHDRAMSMGMWRKAVQLGIAHELLERQLERSTPKEAP